IVKMVSGTYLKATLCLKERVNGMRHRLLSSALIIVALLAAGCATVTDAVTQTTQAVDRAIADINRNSSAWQQILQGLANDLPKQLNESIRTEVQNLADRSIAAAGIEFRCNVDFLSSRAIV